MPQTPLTPQQWQNRLTELEVELNHGDGSTAQRLSSYLGLAALYYQARNYQAALNHYRLALRCSSEDLDALLGQGNALRHLQQQELAIASYNQALALAPQRADFYCNRGRAQEHLGHDNAALKSYNQSLRLEPSQHQLWQRRGHLLYRQERYGGALISYAQAQFREPRVADKLAEQSLFITSPGPYVKRYAAAFGESDARLARTCHDGKAWQLQAQQLRQLGFEPEAAASANQAERLGFPPFPSQIPVLQP